MSETAFDLDSVLAETIEFLTVRPDGDGFVGDTPGWFGPHLFGGFIVGQAVHAATRTGEVFASSDDGDMWTEVAAHLPPVLSVRATAG